MIKRSVCHITTSFPLHEGHPSGWFVWEQVRRLPKAGWDVSVLAPHAKDAKRRETVKGIQINRYRYMNDASETVAYGGGIPANLGEKKARWLLVPPFFGFGLIAALKQVGSVDILHAHWSFAGLIALAATRSSKKPFVVTFHGSDLMGASGAMMKVARLVASKAEKVIVHSKAMVEAATKLTDSTKIMLLPHGVDVDKFDLADTSGSNPVRIIAVGRLSPEKGFDLLVDALGRLGDQFKWECTFIGEGPQRKLLEGRIEKYGIESQVHLPGAVPHDRLVRLLAESQIGVVPSRREGFGMACLEQCASGLPVVVSKCGGLEDIVIDGETGIIVPVENPEKLADALEKLISNKKLRQDMGQAGRKRAAEEFSYKVASEKLIEIYNRVLAKEN